MSLKIKLSNRLFEADEQQQPTASAPAQNTAAPATAAQPAQNTVAPATTAQPSTAQTPAANDQAQQPSVTDPNEVIKSLSTFLTGVFNTLKTSLAPDAMTKAIPALKAAKEQKLPYSDAVNSLEVAVINFSKIDVTDIKNVKAASDAFTSVLSNIATFTEAVQKSAEQPAQPVDTSTATAQPAQTTAPAAPAQ